MYLFRGWENELSKFKLLIKPWKFKFYAVRVFEYSQCRRVINFCLDISSKLGKTSSFSIILRPKGAQK